MRSLLCCLLISLLLSPIVFAADEHLELGRTKVYLPGDVVHVVVGAPVDTTRVTALMPDETALNMDYERRTHTWHGHWEVPYGFDKGTYYAKLEAADVEGRVFSGQSIPFYIGEPTLVMLVGMEELTREKAARKKPAKVADEYVTIKTAEPAPAPPAVVRKQVEPIPQEELEKRIAAEKAAREKAAVKPKPKPKPVPRPAPKPKAKPAVAKVVEPEPALSAKDQALIKARAVGAARFYIKKGEYEKAREQLAGLLKNEPDNKELSALVARLNVLIKAEETK